VLRRHVPANLAAFQRWYGDAEVARLTRYQDGPMRPDEIERFFMLRAMGPDSMAMGIHVRATDRLIGSCAFSQLDGDNGSVLFHITIGEHDAWGHGYGGEATSLMVGAGVGAGIMAVPYLAQQVGLVGLAIILPVAWAASALVHLMLAEVLFRTGRDLQVVELMQLYVLRGRIGRVVLWSVFALLSVAFLANLAAYVSGAGEIVASLTGLDRHLAELVVYAVSAGVVFFGLTAVGIAERFGALVLGGLVLAIGVGATRAFVKEVCELAGLDPTAYLARERSRLPWYSRSIDSTYLTGKRVFIFGDATHAIAAAKVATSELGFKVVGLGTYSREFARDIREGRSDE